MPTKQEIDRYEELVRAACFFPHGHSSMHPREYDKARAARDEALAWVTRARRKLAAAAVLALALIATVPVLAAGTRPGVGLPWVPREDFARQWCEQTRPPGRGATCTSLAPVAFDCRLCPSEGWRGYYAEYFPRTEEMLRGCWELNTWGTNATHDGIYTPAELDWAEVAMRRSSQEYRSCWYERTWEGGSPTNAIVIADPRDAERWKFVVDEAKAQGAWRPGVFSYVGWDGNVGGWKSRAAGATWPVWVDNRLTVMPAPAPAPTPIPAPTPAPAPACTPWEGSPAQVRCVGNGHRTRESCAAAAVARPRSEVARLYAMVCPETSPPPPPTPVGTCVNCSTQPFVPGIPSTGKLVIELVCVPAPCPGAV